MISTLLELYGRSPKQQVDIPEKGINIIEWFSEMVPHTWKIPERAKVLDWVHTHMSIHQDSVIKEIADEIESKLDQ